MLRYESTVVEHVSWQVFDEFAHAVASTSRMMAELNRGRKVVSRVCGAATYVMDVKVPHSVEHRPKSTSIDDSFSFT